MCWKGYVGAHIDDVCWKVILWAHGSSVIRGGFNGLHIGCRGGVVLSGNILVACIVFHIAVYIILT